jgi:hypothetical protein
MKRVGKGEKTVDVEKKSAAADDSGSYANEMSACVGKIFCMWIEKSACVNEITACVERIFHVRREKSTCAGKISTCVDEITASAEKKSTSALFSVLDRNFLNSKLISN